MKDSPIQSDVFELPATAKRVLAHFELRARDSFAAIAKATKCSEQLVKYHIHRWREFGFITEWNAIFNPAILGHNLYIVYLSFFGTSTAEEKRWMQQCAKCRGVMVVSLTFGRWNGLVAIWAKTPEALEGLLWKISEPLVGKIADMQVTTRLNSAYGSTKLLHSKYQKINIAAPATERPHELSELDSHILKLLAYNARRSITSISEEVGISPTAVKVRISNLETQNIIVGYRARYGYEMLGYTQYRILIRLAENSSSMVKRITHELFGCGSVIIVSRHLGFSDLDARCFARSVQDLAKLVSHIRDKFSQSIIQVEVVPFMDLLYVNHLPV